MSLPLQTHQSVLVGHRQGKPVYAVTCCESDGPNPGSGSGSGPGTGAVRRGVLVGHRQGRPVYAVGDACLPVTGSGSVSGSAVGRALIGNLVGHHKGRPVYAVAACRRGPAYGPQGSAGSSGSFGSGSSGSWSVGSRQVEMHGSATGPLCYSLQLPGITVPAGTRLFAFAIEWSDHGIDNTCGGGFQWLPSAGGSASFTSGGSFNWTNVVGSLWATGVWGWFPNTGVSDMKGTFQANSVGKNTLKQAALFVRPGNQSGNPAASNFGTTGTPTGGSPGGSAALVAFVLAAFGLVDPVGTPAWTNGFADSGLTETDTYSGHTLTLATGSKSINGGSGGGVLADLIPTLTGISQAGWAEETQGVDIF